MKSRLLTILLDTQYRVGMLVGSVLVIIILVFSLAWGVLQQSREVYKHQAKTDAENLVRVLEHYVHGVLYGIDLTLRNVEDEFQQELATGGIREEDLTAQMRLQQQRLPHIIDLRIADATGNVLYGNAVHDNPPINIADRTYFQQARDAPQPVLVIPQPVFGRISHQWVFPMSRRLQTKSGTFAGVIYANVTPQHLREVFASLNIGQHGIVSMFDPAPSILVRYPEPDGQGSLVGARITSPQILALLQQEHTAASYLARSSLDGILRTFSYHRVGDYPVYAMVGLAEEDYLAKWGQDAKETMGFLAILSALAVLATWLLVQAWRKQDEDLAILSQRDIEMNKLVADLRQSEQRLTEAKQTAEAANKAKGIFLANMSHEIRTPMSAIIGMSRLALKTELMPKQREYLHNTYNAAASLLGVINDILDFSKVEAGRLKLELAAFRPKALLEQVQSLFADQAEEKGVRLVLQIAPEVPAWLEGDFLRLGQVINNLVANAVKFTHQGEILVKIACQRSAEETDRQVILQCQVQDTGIGIDSAWIERLFEAFTQVEGTSNRRYGGTGLGLAICQHLLTLMGGTIEVKSALGQGSCFSLAIPMAVAEPDQSAVATKALTTTQDRYQGTVLLVEDNPVNQQVAREMLTQMGLTVMVAVDGYQALDLAAANYYDLVFMDLHMPGLDGYETTIRLLAQHPDLVVIAMTASAMTWDRQCCLDAGMKGHLAKPIPQEQLIATLNRWLTTSASHDSLPTVPVAAPEKPEETTLIPPLPGFDPVLPCLGGNQHLMRSLLDQFGELLVQLMELLADPGCPSKEKIGQLHTLGGAAAILGARRLGQVSSALEQAFDTVPESGGEQEFEALLSEWYAAASEVRKGLAALPSTLSVVAVAEDPT